MIDKQNRPMTTGHDSLSTDRLFPNAYEELRRLAKYHVSRQRTDSLSATGLVHEAFFRLVKPSSRSSWDTRGHFFSAAANAMRQILVDRARKKNALKRGGDRNRLDIELANIIIPGADRRDQTILQVNDALDELAVDYPVEAKLVELRFFGGLSFADVARTLEIPDSEAKKNGSSQRRRSCGC